MKNNPNNRPANILLVYNEPTRFVKIDLDLLQQCGSVTEWYQKTKRINLPVLFKAVTRSQLVLCWFASWHSLVPVLLARLLRKPAVVVVGGYDTANLPEAGYGSQRGGLPWLVSRAVIHNATHLITNSHSAKREAVVNAGADPNKITVIYHGLPVTADNTFPLERRPIALNVGNVWHENLLRKGLLPFVQVAACLPEVQFIHAGKWHDNSIDILRQHASPNVEFRGFVSDEELQALYRQAAVYVQPSLHEGFGMSVAEAMLAGCIPVVTRCGSLPEVVGNTGVFSQSNQPTDIALAIEQALTFNGTSRHKARNQIARNFPLERRAKELTNLIRQTLA